MELTELKKKKKEGGQAEINTTLILLSQQKESLGQLFNPFTLSREGEITAQTGQSLPCHTCEHYLSDLIQDVVTMAQAHVQ